MTVVSLAAAREERKPHWQGACVCLACRHEWEGVGPIGDHTGLDCPSCELPKGATKYLVGAQPGDLELLCDCGCEALTAYHRKSDGLKRVQCMACGTDLTHAFYE